MRLVLCSALAAICMLVCAAANATLVVKYIGNNPGVKEDYYLELLETALKTTEAKYGPYRLEFLREPLSSERKHELLVAGDRLNVDRIVGFHKSTGQRAALLFVDVPLLRGFMGYRIPLIRRDNQNRFDNVKTLDDLRKIPLGLGKGWEGYIYQSNGFTLYEPISFDLLLKMLAGGRYDFVPLSAIEIEHKYTVDGQELASLVPEKRILIHTPLPNYFYVSPQAPELAARLRVGLRQMESDGRLRAIFDRFFSARLKTLNLRNRIIIEIPNPDDDGTVNKISRKELDSY